MAVEDGYVGRDVVVAVVVRLIDLGASGTVKLRVELVPRLRRDDLLALPTASRAACLQQLEIQLTNRRVAGAQTTHYPLSGGCLAGKWDVLSFTFLKAQAAGLQKTVFSSHFVFENLAGIGAV